MKQVIACMMPVVIKSNSHPDKFFGDREDDSHVRREEARVKDEVVVGGGGSEIELKGQQNDD